MRQCTPLASFCISLSCLVSLINASPAFSSDARFGGTLVISQHGEPKTLNPLTAIDTNSRKIISLIHADLIHINRLTQQVEPALAESWDASGDGRRFTLHLRHNLRFSDGSPCTADDVLFTFAGYLDPKVNSPQRDMLVIAGKPIAVQKLDDFNVVFTLAQPYAAAERIFDGLAILPKHLLAKSAPGGNLGSAWGLATTPSQIAGMGPFRLSQYVPGQRIVLERNPFYWKKDALDRRLPYLDRIVSVLTANADAEVMQFVAGEVDLLDGVSPAGFASLQKDQTHPSFRLYDLGPGLDYVFLFFNQNLPPPGDPQNIGPKQHWFRQVPFRKAISYAIDRQTIVKLAYFGRAFPLSTLVPPADKLWIDSAIAPPRTSLDRARELLRNAGFAWLPDGSLHDHSGLRVQFSISVKAGQPQQSAMAALIQQDLKQIGIQVDLQPLEFRTLLNTVFSTFKYEASLMELVGGDSDPNSEIGVLSSSGGTHLWCLKPNGASETWQKQIDALMQQQMTTLNYSKRKSIYDNVQRLLWENDPVICLISPHILVGAKNRVGNFNPAAVSDYTLWNADLLYIRR